MTHRIAMLLGAFLLFPSTGAMAQDTDVIMDFIDGRYESTADMARTLWEYAEVGYQETQSAALIQAALSADGFAIEAGIAGIPTAFVANYGSGGPVIGIMAEFDALPGINQDALSSRVPIAGKNAGHACGHNLFGAGSTGAAIAIKHWLEESGMPGTIRLFGTPAEEGGSGKVYMVRDGQFDDVDIVLHWHAGDSNSATAELAAATVDAAKPAASSQLGAEHLDRTATEEANDEDEVFYATVTGVTRGRNRILYFHFDDGQIWRQMEARHLEYPSSGEFDINITRGMMGDYRMRIGDNGRMVRIRRVQ